MRVNLTFWIFSLFAIIHHHNEFIHSFLYPNSGSISVLHKIPCKLAIKFLTVIIYTYFSSHYIPSPLTPFLPDLQRHFQLNGYELANGKRLKLNISVPNTRLFVGNIPKSKTRDDICQEFGKIASKSTARARALSLNLRIRCSKKGLNDLWISFP